MLSATDFNYTWQPHTHRDTLTHTYPCCIHSQAHTHACSLKFGLRYGWQIVTSQRNYAAACRSSPRCRQSCCSAPAQIYPLSLPPLPLSTRATWSWATLTSAQTPAASDRDNAEFVISPATTTTRRTWQATEGGVARRDGGSRNLHWQQLQSCKYFVS